MAVVSSREGLTNHALRRLGGGVIKVDLTQDQIDDCVDDTLQMFNEFHDEATNRTYKAFMVSATTAPNRDDSDIEYGGHSPAGERYIQLPDDITGVVRLLKYNNVIGASRGIFSFKYQLQLTTIQNFRAFTGFLSNYVQTRQYLEMLDSVLTSEPQLEFSRIQNRLYVHGGFSDGDIEDGDWVICECFATIDPTQNPKVYNNIFVKNYLEACLKKQWGANLKKYNDVQLVGGVTVSGDQLYEEGSREMAELEEKLRREYEAPPMGFIGA